MNALLTKALLTCPEFGKTDPHARMPILAALVEYLETLPDDLATRMLTLPDGIQTRTKFIPSISDFVEMRLEFEKPMRDREAAREKFRPHTSYRRFEPDETPQESLPRRKAFVLENLGYDPQDNSRLHKTTADEIFVARAAVESYDKAVAEGKPLPLKSPDRPISKYLKDFIAHRNSSAISDKTPKKHFVDAAEMDW